MGGVDDSQRVTITDIAALAGVHVSTVSRALNPRESRRVSPETAERVRQIAAEHGYKPDVFAAGLRGGKAWSVGLLVPDLTDAHTATIIRGIQDELEANSVTANIIETRDEPERRDRAFAFMKSRRSDALIVLSARESDQERLQALSERHPVVLCAQGLPGSELPSVTANDYRGGVLAAEHLHRLGHRLVTQIACDTDIPALDARRAGFESAAATFGLTVVDAPLAAESPTLESGRNVMRQILAQSGPTPTAVFAHSDMMAIGALAAIRDAGRECPGDISVIGFDDSPLAEYVAPTLTTIRVPAYKLGRAAAVLTLRVVHGETPSSVEFTPELIMRQSTAVVS